MVALVENCARYQASLPVAIQGYDLADIASCPFLTETGNCSSRAWGDNEVTLAEGVGYQSIYDNAHGIGDAFVKFWTETAKRWVGNDNIMGYELINEPFAGDCRVLILCADIFTRKCLGKPILFLAWSCWLSKFAATVPGERATSTPSVIETMR